MIEGSKLELDTYGRKCIIVKGDIIYKKGRILDLLFLSFHISYMEIMVKIVKRIMKDSLE